MPIICLEGVDGAGKSTLAREIHETWIAKGQEYTSTLVHTGAPERWNKKDMTLLQWRELCYNRLNAVLKLAEMSIDSQLLVLDRFHYGSYVYGGLYRPEVNDSSGFGDLGVSGLLALDHRIKYLRGITVVVQPSLDVVIQRSTGREDEYLDTVPGHREKQLADIYYRYRRLVGMYHDSLPSFHGVGEYTAAELIEAVYRDPRDCDGEDR